MGGSRCTVVPLWHQISPVVTEGQPGWLRHPKAGKQFPLIICHLHHQVSNSCICSIYSKFYWLILALRNFKLHISPAWLVRMLMFYILIEQDKTGWKLMIVACVRNGRSERKKRLQSFCKHCVCSRQTLKRLLKIILFLF